MRNLLQKKAMILSAVTGLLICTSCNSCPNKGDLTVPQTDATPPTVSLSVGVVGSNSTTTTASGGSAVTLTLGNKTVTLNIAATAKDPESGVQALEIDVGNQIEKICTGPSQCSGGSMGNVSPMWTSSTPAVSPGGSGVSTSTMLESFVPSSVGLLHPQQQPPAGGTLTESFTISAKATNNLGASASTPEITVFSKLP